jgi:hypothetical protein
MFKRAVISLAVLVALIAAPFGVSAAACRVMPKQVTTCLDCCAKMKCCPDAAREKAQPAPPLSSGSAAQQLSAAVAHVVSAFLRDWPPAIESSVPASRTCAAYSVEPLALNCIWLI